MSKFVSPDVSALGDLPTVDLDFEEAREDREALLVAAFEAHGLDWDPADLESDPIRIMIAEAGGYQDVNLHDRINKAMQELSITTDDEDALEHIGASYYGVSRLVTTDDDGEEVDEDIEDFRDRILLAPEAFSVAGPEGAYAFHALELDGVADITDVAVYGLEDGATYSSDVLYADAYTAGKRATAFDGRATGDPVKASEVLIVVVPSVDYGEADQSLLDRVYEAVTDQDVRPVGDCVRIEAASVVDYQVEMTVYYAPGATADPLIEKIEAALTTYTGKRRKVGVAAELLGIGGCGYVTGVESVELTSPVASVGGGQKQVPNCTSITVTAVQTAGRWDD